MVDDTQQTIRASARKLLKKELLPHLEKLEDQGEFAKIALKKLGQAGMAAPMLPEPYGSGDLIAQTLIAEEMGYASSSFGLSVLASVCLFGANVGRQGTDEQKKKYLPGIASGEKIGCWALTEPEVGSDALSVKSRSRKEGDHYIIQGSKTFITNAPIADYFIVITREYDEDQAPIQGFSGGTAFILERGMPGLTTGAPFKKMGHLSSPTGEIFLENVKVHESQVLGQPRKAFFGMKDSLDVERAIFSALGVGIMQFCLDTVVQYCSTRMQFGAPLKDHQLIQVKISQIASWTDVIRSYMMETVRKIEAGQSATKEASILKLLTAQKVFETASEAVQALGGYGYMREYGVERCLRDAKLFDIGGGTSEIQNLIIAKHVIREILENGNAP